MGSWLSFFTQIFCLPTVPERTDDSASPVDVTEWYARSIAGWSLDGAYVALPYTPSVRSRIHAFKYQRVRAHADYFARCLASVAGEYLPDISAEEVLVVPVPTHWMDASLRWGYRPTSLLARTLAHSLKLSYAPVGAKVSHTRRQATLDRHARLTNVRGSFAVSERHADILRGRTVLLVDDVVSTGSTAHEFGRMLRAAGAQRIYGVFVARGTGYDGDGR